MEVAQNGLISTTEGPQSQRKLPFEIDNDTVTTNSNNNNNDNNKINHNSNNYTNRIQIDHFHNNNNIHNVYSSIQTKIIDICMSLLKQLHSNEQQQRAQHFQNQIPDQNQHLQNQTTNQKPSQEQHQEEYKQFHPQQRHLLKNTITTLFSTSNISHINPPPSIRQGVDYNSIGLLIYTSGTSGLPKAAILRHSRIISSGFVFTQNFGFKQTDRLYTVLPLYHSAGGVCSTYATVLTGSSLVIKKKLSTTEFWKDCCDYKVTIIQYIGELCRYLLNTSIITHPTYNPMYEKLHNVRMAFGNGLRSDIWLNFQQRFNIDTIAEFYAATEGNIALFCLYNRSMFIFILIFFCQLILLIFVVCLYYCLPTTI